MSVRIVWDDAAFSKILTETMVPHAVEKAAGVLRDRAKRKLTDAGRIDTGALRNSITSRRVDNGKVVRYEVGTDLPYAYYQHEGVEGPIYPRRAKVLRFTAKGGKVVFAAFVSGFKGVPYLTDPLHDMQISDFL